MLAVLSFLATTANAKPAIITAISITSTTNDLSDRLASDNDFQEFTVSMYQFLKKIQSTGSSNLLAKYSNQTASKEDKQNLANSFGFDSELTFRNFLINLYIQGAKLNEKFSELKEFTKNESSIRLAARNVIKSKLKPTVTEEECWEAFFALTAFWSLYCQQATDWSSCITYSYAAIAGFTIGCLTAVEP